MDLLFYFRPERCVYRNMGTRSTGILPSPALPHDSWGGAVPHYRQPLFG